MRKFLLLLVMALTVFSADAIILKYDNLNKTKKTCRLAGCSGTEPTSGKLVLKGTYEEDGVTYKVTSIAPNVFRNLVSTYEITIPASITKIGNISGAEPSIGAEKGSLMNFFTCPKLRKFIVEEGNKAFAANDEGWLMSKDGRNVYCIPRGINYNNGQLKMSNYIHYIYADAFGENSTVSSVSLPGGLKAFYPSCAIYRLSGVREYSAPELCTAVKTVDGVLFNLSSSVLYAYPPGRQDDTYTIPSSVTAIGQYAFKNNHVLRTVKHTSVRKIEERAFEGASYMYVFDGPAPDEVQTRAFYKASNLNSFPFSGSTTLKGDSIFFETGFSMVSFDDDIFIPSGVTNRYTFSDERLGVIRMGSMVFGSDNPQDVYPFYSDFASGCKSLVGVTLPGRCVFKADKGRPAFCGTSDMEYIHTGSFRVEGGNVPFPFDVYVSYYHPLRIFTATNSSTADIDKYAEWGQLLKYTGTGGISPLIYTDMRAPYAPNSQSHYIYRTADGYATYYVPGRCAQYYQEAKDEHCPVYEMYDLELIEKAGKVVFRYKSNQSFLRMSRLVVNGSTTVKIDGDGDYETGVSVSEFETVRMEYRVRIDSPFHDGPGMSTTYSRTDFGLAGVDDIEADKVDAPVEYFNLQGVRVDDPAHGIYIRRQGTEVEKVAIP